MKETRYITKPFSKLTDEEIQACSMLYSSHYGVYSGKGDKKRGERIRISSGWYKRNYFEKPNIYISMCYSTTSNELLGHAIFIRKNIEGKGTCAWVLQLVVHSLYRKRGIGKDLLQSAWGFSDYYAWGLATANAITLKTLESVSWRQVSVEMIQQNIDALEQMMDDIDFVQKDKICLSSNVSQVFTNFYPELENSNEDKTLAIYASRLGKIEPGYEWLAFTFATQKMTFTPEKFERFLNFSEQQLQDAYSRMNMPNQAWTQGTSAEIEFILSQLTPSHSASILDIGCGQGRHTIELAKQNFANVVGIDFSDSNIAKAKENAKAEGVFPTFVTADARKYKTGIKSDYVLCLYDVIGSFRNTDDNIRIIKSIKTNLKSGGIAVVSVMNMEFTDSIAKYKQSISANPEALLKLPPSRTMEKTGDIFNPDYFIINTDDGLVYRKEQFTGGDEIFAEYVVADKRYYMEEIKEIFLTEGFKILDARFVSAGHFDTPLPPTKAKEILLLVEAK